MKKELFGIVDGNEVYRYLLAGDGVDVAVIDYGAAVQSISVDGIEIVQSFSRAEDYKIRPGYVCGAIGRVSNRIANAEFALNGKTFHLSANEGENQLHGGIEGFNHKFFKAEEIENGVKMTYLSEDGEEGYPGNLLFTVKFTLVGRTFNIEYTAVSDKDTLFAPTHHFYFNLNGQVGGANSNKLAIYADGYVPVDKSLIPTGDVLPVDKTPFDFRTMKSVNRDKTDMGIFDHCFILNGNHVATIIGDKSGIKAEIYTDMPAVQLYSGAGGDEKERRTRPDESRRSCLRAAIRSQRRQYAGIRKTDFKSGRKKGAFHKAGFLTGKLKILYVYKLIPCDFAGDF